MAATLPAPAVLEGSSLAAGLASSFSPVFFRGFVEKTAKYTKFWVSRYLRLEDRLVSYAMDEDSKTKGTIRLLRVERYAETTRVTPSDTRDLYGMVLYGEDDQRWVIRCVTEESFRRWYLHFQEALWQHGLAERLDGGLGDRDPRLALPCTRIPLRDLSRFLRLEQAVIYGFYHVAFTVPLQSRQEADGVVVLGDHAIYLCDADGTILRCIPYQALLSVQYAHRKEGGAFVALVLQRPEPDLIVRFEHADTVRELLAVMRTIYRFAVRPDVEAGRLDFHRGELQITQLTRLSYEAFNVVPPIGYQLVVILPTTKAQLAQALLAAQAAREAPQRSTSRAKSPTSTSTTTKGPPAAGLPSILRSPTRRGPEALGDSSERGSHRTFRFRQPHVVPDAADPPLRLTMGSFLAGLGLGQYEATLKSAGADIDVLLSATASDLLRLGVKNRREREFIVAKARQLSSDLTAQAAKGTARRRTHSSASETRRGADDKAAKRAQSAPAANTELEHSPLALSQRSSWTLSSNTSNAVRVPPRSVSTWTMEGLESITTASTSPSLAVVGAQWTSSSSTSKEQGELGPGSFTASSSGAHSDASVPPLSLSFAGVARPPAPTGPASDCPPSISPLSEVSL